MPSENLRVSTAHLRGLAARHDRAAGELAAAACAVTGVDQQVRISHGSAAAPTAQALSAIERARRAAGRDIVGVSRQLGGDLSVAAAHHDTTDHLFDRCMNRFLQ
jgi:Excreted virulence factor EspC, type VII ESX diderm